MSLENYNLELGEDPFSARFISTPEEELPLECVLPTATSYTPLPPITLELPDLTCKFDVDEQVVAPTFFCTPTITAVAGASTVDITPPPGSDPVTGTLTLTIDDNPTGDCDNEFTISADLELDLSALSAGGGGGIETVGEESIVSSCTPVFLPRLLLTEEGELTLAGQTPFPCFICDPEAVVDEDYQITELELEILKPSEITFNNSCCENDYSFWDNCGKFFQVGDNEDANYFKINFNATPNVVEWNDGLEGQLLYMDVDLLKPPLDASVEGIKPRILWVCTEAGLKVVLTLMSEPYDP